MVSCRPLIQLGFVTENRFPCHLQGQSILSPHLPPTPCRGMWGDALYSPVTVSLTYHRTQSRGPQPSSCRGPFLQLLPGGEEL